MVSLVFGMIRKNRFNFVDVYREEAFVAIRATVKQVRYLSNIVVVVSGEMLQKSVKNNTPKESLQTHCELWAFFMIWNRCTLYKSPLDNKS